MKRELAAAVAIPLVLAALFIAPPIVFNALVCALTLGAVWEFYRLAERTGHPVAKTVGLASSALLLGGAALLWGPIRFETRAGEVVEIAVRSGPAFWFAAGTLSVLLAAVAPLFSGIPAPAAL